MRLHGDLGIDDEALHEFACRNGITHLALFGSALGDDFRADSDVDLLVEFDADRIPGLFGIAAMEQELESLLGRRVDLRTYHDLSRYFRDDVVRNSRVLYAA